MHPTIMYTHARTRAHTHAHARTHARKYGGWNSIIGIVTVLWDTPTVVQIAKIPRDFSSEHPDL
jgi:hypothetical protein